MIFGLAENQPPPPYLIPLKMVIARELKQSKPVELHFSRPQHNETFALQKYKKETISDNIILYSAIIFLSLSLVSG